MTKELLDNTAISPWEVVSVGLSAKNSRYFIMDKLSALSASAILETTNAALDTVDIAKTELDTKKNKKNIKRKTSKS